MRLWLLRQAHPDLSKLELEVSTSCLSKISLLRLLLGQTNRDKDFPESLRYSETIRIFQETSRTCENKASLSLTVLSKVTDATMASKS